MSDSDIHSTLNNVLQPILWAAFVVYPLAILRDLRSLSVAALISILMIIYTILVIIVEMPFYYENKPSDEKMSWVLIHWEILDVFAMSFLAFANQTNFYNVYYEMKNSTPKRIKKVNNIYIYINIYLFIYIYIGNPYKCIGEFGIISFYINLRLFVHI